MCAPRACEVDLLALNCLLLFFSVSLIGTITLRDDTQSSSGKINIDTLLTTILSVKKDINRLRDQVSGLNGRLVNKEEHLNPPF